MSFSIRRRLHFCAGHRVYGHESKCAYPHGHNYLVFVEVAPIEDLDEIGRVVDFSVVKEKVGGWIDKNLDHSFLVFSEDKAMLAVLDHIAKADTLDEKMADRVSGYRYFVMSSNPTAENIAELIATNAAVLLSDYGIRVVSVTVEETMNCSASFFPG